MNDNTLALTQEELVLLKNSEEGKDIETYGNLYEIATKYKSIKHSDIEKIGLDETAKLVLKSGKANLFTNIMMEWYARKDEDIANSDETVKCGLCGRENTYIFYIRNRYNEAELHVGSSCIRKFSGIENSNEILKMFNGNKKIREEQRRINAFLKKIPNADNLISKSRREFHELPVLLPWDLYNSLDEEILNLNKIYNDFKSSGNINNLENVISQFKESEEVYKVLKQQANKFVMKRESTENQTIICKRRECRWLLDTGNKKLFRRIAEDQGLYTPDTIKEISSHDFISELKPVIQKCCEDTAFKIKEVRYEDKKLVFLIDDRIHRDVLEATVPEEQFMRSIGWKCVFQENYKIMINPEVFTITSSKRNINVILSRVNRAISKTEYLIEFVYDDDHERLYFEKRINGTYMVLGTEFFLKQYLRNIDLSEKKLREVYINYFHELDKDKGWLLIKDRMERYEFEKMMAKEKLGRKRA
ncbi:MAG: hypothetical protein PHE79_01835 [Eubacteriales bacterium]|nr:hypothetical protein [Eubacteriales bacterium]